MDSQVIENRAMATITVLEHAFLADVTETSSTVPEEHRNTV